MRKIIREILALLWKLLKIVFWKWLKPILGRVIVYAVLATIAIVTLVLILGRC